MKENRYTIVQRDKKTSISNLKWKDSNQYKNQMELIQVTNSASHRTGLEAEGNGIKKGKGKGTHTRIYPA